MFFWLKKTISTFLLPLQFGLLWILLGIILLIIGRTKSVHAACLIIGFCIITFFALNPVSAALLNTLQSRYSPLTHPPQSISEVVVLGAGTSGKKDYPPNLTLSATSLSRLIEGIRLFKEIEKNNPNAKLILSGGKVFESIAVAGKMRNTAVMLGVNEKNIVLENGSVDTRQEALYLKNTLGDKPFILVTSAYHMMRSMALFEKLNMHPIPAPTQFITFHYSFILWYIPNANSLVLSNIAIHEYMGLLWAKLRGETA